MAEIEKVEFVFPDETEQKVEEESTKGQDDGIEVVDDTPAEDQNRQLQLLS